MRSKLEDFINEHREEFDSSVMKGGWEKIEHKMHRSPLRGNVLIKRLSWMVAAAAVVIFGISVFFLNSNKNDSVNTIPQPGNTTQKAAGEDNEYNHQMFLFVSLIEAKQRELRQAGEKHPELYQQFIKDVDALDSAFRELKQTLPDNPNKELLMEAMIKNLQLQIDLLNRQLQIIKQLKQTEKNYESKTI